jgi:hypothetical protein
MGVPKLDELMDELSEMITGYPDGLPSAMLHMLDDKGQLYAVALALESGAMVAPIARLVVAKQDPAVAVLAVEAKTATTRTSVRDETDPDKQRLLRGELRVSELPNSKQQQMLMIYGEDRIGNEATRLWMMEADSPGGPRRYAPLEHQITDVLHDRLRPMYLFRELMAERRMTEYQARKHARERATKELDRLGMVEQPTPVPTQSWWPGTSTRMH